mmetsp:Transcript_46171/g.109296  ORF Transcript_46171/g.109296 Transcript_46171/m.109296 type:complete len:276 (-) Transcript_46171:1116-1943(-)
MVLPLQRAVHLLLVGALRIVLGVRRRRLQLIHLIHLVADRPRGRHHIWVLVLEQPDHAVDDDFQQARVERQLERALDDGQQAAGSAAHVGHLILDHLKSSVDEEDLEEVAREVPQHRQTQLAVQHPLAEARGAAPISGELVARVCSELGVAAEAEEGEEGVAGGEAHAVRGLRHRLEERRDQRLLYLGGGEGSGSQADGLDHAQLLPPEAVLPLDSCEHFANRLDDLVVAVGVRLDQQRQQRRQLREHRRPHLGRVVAQERSEHALEVLDGGGRV